MTRDEIPSLITYLERKGARFRGSTPKLLTNFCPIAPHKRDHFAVEISTDERPQLWHCHDHKEGGTLIDWISKETGRPANEIFKEMAQETPSLGPSASQKRPFVSRQPTRQQNDSRSQINDSDIVEVYPYTDESGRVLFECCRLTPLPNGKKRFCQRRPSPKGYIYNLEGVSRTIFQLPKVLLAKEVAICEGEKDALTTTRYGGGIIGTCNPMGVKKWLDGYAQYFERKNVFVFQDNDQDGPGHADQVTASVVKCANSLKRPQIPPVYKDVTEYLEIFPEEQRAAELKKLLKAAVPIKEAPPIYLIHEFEDTICDDFKRNGEHNLDLGKFLPSLGNLVGEPLQQGELGIFLGDVGIGKTAILQGLARSATPLPTLFFEMELGKRLFFIRTIQQALPSTYREVYDQYKNYPDERYAESYESLKHIAFCWKSGLTPAQIEDWIGKAELKFDRPIVLACIDYIGLINAKGKSRYEIVSNAAESLKKIASNTNTIILATSQIHRKGSESCETEEIYLHDARDSGSIEASAQLLVGCYRAQQNPRKRMVLKILKNTKGQSAIKTEVCFDGKTMRLSEPPIQQNL